MTLDLDRKLTELAKRKPLDMTAVMEMAEDIVPQLLVDRSRWQSLMIDYQPPHLMRIFTQCEGVRINLHYFMAAKDLPETRLTKGYDENLYHPHGWASAMRILEGSYEQWIGFAQGPGIEAAPKKTLHLVHKPGDSYAMNDPYLWHQVIPRENQPVSTLMVTFMPDDWDQVLPKSTKDLRALNEKEMDFMFAHFQQFYPPQHTPHQKSKPNKPGL